MPQTARIPINPEVLTWARKTARLDVRSAAQQLRISQSQLENWENGNVTPTLNQLRAMANLYNRPLSAMFLPEPLKDERIARLPDFRRADVQERPDSFVLRKAILRAAAQQAALREIASELEINGSANIQLSASSSPEHSGEQLRQALRMDSIPEKARRNVAEFLRTLIRATERLNVLVVQVQRIDVETMRGFSLGEGDFPIVALNGADWPRGKVFTLLHELAHVALRSSGICDMDRHESKAIERQCDLVAASALMPRSEFNRTVKTPQTGKLTFDFARAVGSSFGTSGEAATLRMIELGLAEWADYWRLKPEFSAAFRSHKDDEKLKGADKDAPIYYQLKVRDLGRPFIRNVLRAHGEDILSSRDTANLLEVGYDKISKLAEATGTQTPV